MQAEFVWQAADSLIKALSTGLLVRLAAQCPDCEPSLTCAACPDCVCNHDGSRATTTKRAEPASSPLFIFILGVVLGAAAGWWLFSAVKPEKEEWRQTRGGHRALGRGVLRTG